MELHIGSQSRREPRSITPQFIPDDAQHISVYRMSIFSWSWLIPRAIATVFDGPDEMTTGRPSASFLDDALHQSIENGQFTLAAFGNPYFDSSSYISRETSIATSVQAEVGPELSLRHDDASSVLSSAQLSFQSASFVTTAQQTPNMPFPSITHQTGVPSLYCQPPLMPLPTNPWSSPYTQRQAPPIETAHCYSPTRYHLSNPTIPAPQAQQPLANDVFAIEKMASEPEVADTAAVARAENPRTHQRAQSSNTAQTGETGSKRPLWGTRTHKSSRSLPSGGSRMTKPAIPGQFVFAVEPPQMVGSGSTVRSEAINNDSSMRTTCLLQDSHDYHGPTPYCGSTSTTAASSSHTFSGTVTPSLGMSPGQGSSYRSRARNRISASRCRAKRRASVANLKIKDQEVADEREELEETVRLLKFEVWSLKDELLRHAHCDCVVIREYLALESRKILETARQAYHLSFPVSQENEVFSDKFGVD